MYIQKSALKSHVRATIATVINSLGLVPGIAYSKREIQEAARNLRKPQLMQLIENKLNQKLLKEDDDLDVPGEPAATEASVDAPEAAAYSEPYRNFLNLAGRSPRFWSARVTPTGHIEIKSGVVEGAKSDTMAGPFKNPGAKLNKWMEQLETKGYQEVPAVPATRAEAYGTHGAAFGDVSDVRAQKLAALQADREARRAGRVASKEERIKQYEDEKAARAAAREAQKLAAIRAAAGEKAVAEPSAGASTRKIYGKMKAGDQMYPVHTGVKSKKYHPAPGTETKFKPGSYAYMTVDPDGRLVVKDPHSDHTQVWEENVVRKFVHQTVLNAFRGIINGQSR